MWGIGSRKKPDSRKNRKKQQAGKSFSRLLFAFLWKIFKQPAVCCGIGLILFFIWFKQSGDYDKILTSLTGLYDSSQRNSGMVLENILLDGHKYTHKEEIIAAVTGKDDDVKIYIGYPIMAIDLWKIKANLEKLTWIKSANVTRQLPSTLSISVIERQPMALWQNNSTVTLIDSEGEIINEQKLDKFTNLIILVGNNVPHNAGHFLKFISTTPAVANMISSGILVNGRRWNVKLKNGILIKLPEDNPERAWQFLTKKQVENKILESNVQVIDLRIEKKMFVK